MLVLKIYNKQAVINQESSTVMATCRWTSCGTTLLPSALTTTTVGAL